jgi:hypothetical protein
MKKTRNDLIQEYIIREINESARENTYTKYDIFLNNKTLRLRRLGLKRMSGIFDSYRLENNETLTSGHLMKLFKNAEFPYYIGENFVVLFSEKDAFMCKMGGVSTWIESSDKGD